MKTWMPKEAKIDFLKSLARAAAKAADDGLFKQGIPGGTNRALESAFILCAILQDYGVEYTEEMWQEIEKEDGVCVERS